MPALAYSILFQRLRSLLPSTNMLKNIDGNIPGNNLPISQPPAQRASGARWSPRETFPGPGLAARGE